MISFVGFVHTRVRLVICCHAHVEFCFSCVIMQRFLTVCASVIPEMCFFFTVNTQITTGPDAPKSDWRVGLQGFMEKEAFRLLCEVKRRLYKACFSAAWCSQKGHFLKRRLTDNVDVCRAVGVAGCSFTHCGK